MICDPHSVSENPAANISVESTTSHNLTSTTDKMSESVKCLFLAKFCFISSSCHNSNFFVIHCLAYRGSMSMVFGICWTINLGMVCEILAYMMFSRNFN